MTDPDKGRVTAGIPGLSPLTRSALNKRAQQKDYHHNLALEAIEKATVTVADDGDMPVTVAAARMGRPLAAAEIQRRLKALNRSLHFEVSKGDPTKMGIYIPDTDHDGQPLKRFICGMESGISPEFSIRHSRDKEIPNPEASGEKITIQEFASETRGWRTVLARLIRERIITPLEADKAFQVTQGKPSANWKLFTT